MKSIPEIFQRITDKNLKIAIQEIEEDTQLGISRSRL